MADGQRIVYLSDAERENGAVTAGVGISRRASRAQDRRALRLYANIFEQTNAGDSGAEPRQLHCAGESDAGAASAIALKNCADTTRACWPRATPVSVYRELWQALHTHGHWQAGCGIDAKGRRSVKWTNISVLRDANGEITTYLGLFTDITERKRRKRASDIWPTTNSGLFNRSLQERQARRFSPAPPPPAAAWR